MTSDRSRAHAPSRSWSSHVAPLAWFVLLAIVLTWPLVLSPFSRLGALEGAGDPYLNLWILGWDLGTISRSPLSLLDGRIFDANIFHPARQTLTYSDHFILQAIAVWPLYALTGNIVFCYNALLLGSLVGAAMAMYAFILGVTGSRWGAVLAGTVWGFWPYHFAHLGHIQLQALYFLPLAALYLHRLVAGRLRRDALLFGLFAGLQAAASVYYGVMGSLGLVVGAVALVIGVGGRHAGTLIRRGLLAAAIGLLVIAPVTWPYLESQSREGFGRNLFEAARHAATWRSYVSVPAVNLLYGGSGLLTTDAGAESELFPGFIVIALAGCGLIAARRLGHWPLALSASAITLTGIVLSLGPDGVRPLYALLQRLVFGFHAIRAPARFAVLVAFGLSTLAAIGLRALMRDRRLGGGLGLGDGGVASATSAAAEAGGTRSRAWRRALLPMAVIALVSLEFANAPMGWTMAPALRTPTGQWLAQAPRGAVVYLPFTIDFANTPFMVESLEHRLPIVNGYSGQRPPFYATIVDALHAFPSAEAMFALKDFEVRYVVTGEPVAGVDAGEWPLALRAHFDARPQAGAEAAQPERFIYEVVWSPEAEARLGEPEVPEPPPPGPPPFAIGETLTYAVSWDGPAGRVSAGQVELAVEAPSSGASAAGASDAASGASAGAAAASAPDEAYRFRVRAKTADWISKFFEADDQFVTLATSGLMPVTHERRLREGRRRVDQTQVYDAAEGVVRVAGDPDRPPLRVWRHSRDPVSAFFYLRTLALQPGTQLQIPVNDNGRNLLLDLRVEQVERIRVAGRDVEALRLTPVLRQRVPRRQPPAITVWLSRDGRQIPLAAEVSAGFGDVRLELSSAAPR